MSQKKRGNKKSTNTNSGVSLAQKAAGKKATPPAQGKRRKNSTGRSVAIAVLVTVIAAALTVLIVFGIKVYQTIVSPKGNVGDITLTDHVSTPENLQDKMGYYIVGMLGEEIESPTELLALVCWDKRENTMNILQIPQDTYLGDTDRWTVKRAADVWGNPKPLDWCISCRKSVSKEEISDNKHNVCGTTITKAKGSASQGLYAVVNELFGLPVDGYFLFPQQALVKLTDLLGGLDVDLESAMTVDDIDYKKGVYTIHGNAALQYLTSRQSGVTGDINRGVKARKVFTALFQRLARQDENRLSTGSIGPLMRGSTPIRTNLSTDQLVALLTGMKNVTPDSMTAYVLPGRTGSAGGRTYFAPHRDGFLSLINEAFRPYGDPLTLEDLGITELGSGKASDTHRQVLSEIAVEQSGAVATTTNTTATTKAA